MYEIDDDNVDTGCDDEAYRDQQFLSGRDLGDENDLDIDCESGKHCVWCIEDRCAYCCNCAVGALFFSAVLFGGWHYLAAFSETRAKTTLRTSAAGKG